MIIPQNLAATSSLDGFKNYQSATFSTSIAGQTLTAGAFVSATATTALNNTNSISQVQVQYPELDSRWNIVYGSINNYFAASTYEVESFYFFSTTTLSVFTVVANQTGGNVTIPSITINCRGFSFLAPF